MKKNLIISAVFFMTACCLCRLARCEPADQILKFKCSSDASAAVAIGSDSFVIGDDEDNILRVYKIVHNSEPIYSFHLDSFLAVDRKHPEADIEGATKIGDRIYWITSHGRNKDGKPRASRYRFFAVDIVKQGDEIKLKPVGKSYFDLAHQMVKDRNLRFLNLDKATRFYDINLSKKQRSLLAPKAQGLNIEALCASADGKIIYIGLRNPHHQGKAIVIPLLNAPAVIEKMSNPEFGKPILWDFDKRGIRSFEYSPYHKAYFIIAGPVDSESTFRLYKWSGQKDSEPKLLDQTFLPDFTPEALIVFDDKPEMLILSDDGSLKVKVKGPSECMQGQYDESTGTCSNKHLLIPQMKTFRAIWFTP